MLIIYVIFILDSLILDFRDWSDKDIDSYFSVYLTGSTRMSILKNFLNVIFVFVWK